MHRITADNPVRRRLFPAEGDEASNDNFFNGLQEAADRDRKEKMLKWNFDFQNDRPLEGKYTWIHFTDPEQWIGVDTENETKIESIDEDLVAPMKLKNEMTPKAKNDKEPKPKSLKRKLSGSNVIIKKVVRRRIQL